MSESLESRTVLEQASSMSPLELRILQALREKGPGLPFEIAVRVLKLPEEITEPLAELKVKALIRSERFSGTSLGDELIAISAAGEQVLIASERLEKQAEVINKPRNVNPEEPSPKGSTTQRTETQEADLLSKLGDLAAAKGDLDGASTYYKQALEMVRQLRDKPLT
jgi:hypothetical protein